MLIFPQLASSTVISRVRRRTVVNSLANGNTIVFGDQDAGQSEWDLGLAGLTRAEWESVEALFLEVGGRWKGFTFLDPTGNLLAESEHFSQGVWLKGPLLEFTPGVADPLGTSR